MNIIASAAVPRFNPSNWTCTPSYLDEGSSIVRMLPKGDPHRWVFPEFPHLMRAVMAQAVSECYWGGVEYALGAGSDGFKNLRDVLGDIRKRDWDTFADGLGRFDGGGFNHSDPEISLRNETPEMIETGWARQAIIVEFGEGYCLRVEQISLCRRDRAVIYQMRQIRLTSQDSAEGTVKKEVPAFRQEGKEWEPKLD